LAEKTIRTSGIPGGCLVVSVERGGREILPGADLMLIAGDHLTVLVPEDETDKVMEIIRKATGL
jgi:Trk K+ transport system NAD-binding subunit